MIRFAFCTILALGALSLTVAILSPRPAEPPALPRDDRPGEPEAVASVEHRLRAHEALIRDLTKRVAKLEGR